MAEHYYKSDANYLAMVKAIMDAFKVFIIKMLYLEEDYDTAKKRFILADFSAGEEVAIRRSVEFFKNSQANFPFTAYNISEEETLGDTLGTSLWRKTGLYYNPNYQAYMKSILCSIEIPCMSFFSNPSDYHHARILLADTDIIVTRLFVPIYINGIIAEFPIDIDFEVTKGNLAYALEEHLRVGKIYNIAHTHKIFFPYLVINNANVHNDYTPLRIAPVDEIDFSLYSFSNQHYYDNPKLIDTKTSPDIPVVSSTSPTEGETDFDKSSPILINFSLAMNEDSVYNSFTSDPVIDAEYLWNTDSKQFIIDPIADLESGTLYSITIAQTAKSEDTVPLEDDFVLTFTTSV
jgi:hypothetical protein